MEQYQYRLNQEPILKPQNQFLRIWSPLFIKWGIAVAVSMASGMIFEVIVIARESGADLKSIQDIYQLQAAFEQYMGRISDSAELAREMAQEFIKYATPIEGFAALITIPVMLFMFHRDRVREKESGFVPNNKAALWKYAGIFILALAVTLGLNNIIEISGIYEMSESYEETMEALYAAADADRMPGRTDTGVRGAGVSGAYVPACAPGGVFFARSGLFFLCVRLSPRQFCTDLIWVFHGIYVLLSV